jgi:glyoxylase-like metal-dependent hydrolase (beta-lactamase superfamily II)
VTSGPGGGGAALVALALLGATAGAAQQAPAVEIRTTELTPHLYALAGRGGTIGLSIGEDGVLLVDDQYAPLTESILAAIGELTDQPVRFVLNTHWHGDHTGGNENLGRAGALIVAHENVRARMSTDQFLEAIQRAIPASPAAALPVITFSDAVTFYWNDEEIHAYHVEPAHTDGDSVVVFRKADVVHAGDIFWNSGYPLIDLSSGGSIDGMIRVVRDLLATTGPATRFIPGHGAVGDRADVAAYLRMLETTRATIAEMIANGASLEEVQAAKPTAPFDTARGTAFYSKEQYVSFVYDSINRER